MLQINEIKKFKHYTFIARVNVPNSDYDEIITIQMKSDNDADMIKELENTIKIIETNIVDCSWYKVINNRNGLVVA